MSSKHKYKSPKVESWPCDGWLMGCPPPWFYASDRLVCCQRVCGDHERRRRCLLEYWKKTDRPFAEIRQRDGSRPGSVVAREIGGRVQHRAEGLAEAIKTAAVRALRELTIPAPVRKAAVRALRGKRAIGQWVGAVCKVLYQKARTSVQGTKWRREFSDAYERLGGLEAAAEWDRKAISPIFDEYYRRGRWRQGPGRRGRPSKLHPAIIEWFRFELVKQELIHGPDPKKRAGRHGPLSSAERAAATICQLSEDQAREYRRSRGPRWIRKANGEIIKYHKKITGKIVVRQRRRCRKATGKTIVRQMRKLLG